MIPPKVTKTTCNFLICVVMHDIDGGQVDTVTVPLSDLVPLHNMMEVTVLN